MVRLFYSNYVVRISGLCGWKRMWLVGGLKTKITSVTAWSESRSECSEVAVFWLWVKSLSLGLSPVGLSPLGHDWGISSSGTMSHESSRTEWLPSLATRLCSAPEIAWINPVKEDPKSHQYDPPSTPIPKITSIHFFLELFKIYPWGFEKIIEARFLVIY